MSTRVLILAASFCCLNELNVVTSQPPVVSFMGQASRLQEDQSIDFYFNCHTIGEYIQWQYNENTLGQLSPDRNNAITISNSSLSVFVTATLLFPRAPPDGTRQAELTSILVVSFFNHSSAPFIVKCGNEIEFSSVAAKITNDVFTEVTESTRRGRELALDHVFTSRNIVPSRSMTHLFICGTQGTPQKIKISGHSLGFSDVDSIGNVRMIFINDSIDIQLILIGQKLYLITTLIIIAADNSEIQVNCSALAYSVSLSSEHNRTKGFSQESNSTTTGTTTNLQEIASKFET